MNFIDTHLLSLILFFPALAAVVMLFLPKDENKLLRWFAFGASLVPFVLTLIVWFRFNSSQPGFQFEEIIYLVSGDWLIPAPRRGRSLAHDGLVDYITHAACHPCLIQHY